MVSSRPASGPRTWCRAARRSRLASMRARSALFCFRALAFALAAAASSALAPAPASSALDSPLSLPRGGCPQPKDGMSEVEFNEARRAASNLPRTCVRDANAYATRTRVDHRRRALADGRLPAGPALVARRHFARRRVDGTHAVTEVRPCGISHVGRPRPVALNITDIAFNSCVALYCHP